MPRVIRTLWFEELSFLREPFFDTPLGKLTFRQMLIIVTFGALAWGATSLAFDAMLKLLLGGSIFIVGLALAFQRVKTVTPEMCILLMLSSSTSTKLIPKPKPIPASPATESTSKPLEAKALNISTQDIQSIVPVKVVGVLKNPATGRAIQRKGFEVLVEGKSYTKGSTDDEGFFTVYFIPESYGSFKVEVKPEGYTQVLETLVVNVQPAQRDLVAKRDMK
ncbi:MAG: hypothetical protein M1503_03165 [Thaumarchaeota archaeon]|nr:hypothetical protein [Nitrososphaerota archaeon]MCL5317252.1 hypothetical protein [Nitrososphaerota archaeon]